ncbi:MAG: class IV adenylate cyclase [Richelia sp. RM2_1_2]|nr:class IV adenylate cyclase [Richelia sp. RM1_1_1]NJO63368.1 class IV adenylate cyclase [Richelia sp. RM2_1_2]
MPIEVELKFRIDKENIQEIINKLTNKNYITNGRLYEKNVMYDNPNQLMQISDGRIRLRQSGDSTEFCYKKPIKDGSGIKKEIEYQVNTTDFNTTEKILEMMEFLPASSYERYRTKIKGDNILATIDEYPFDNFVEIEGEEEEIKKLAQELDFDLSNNLVEPCDSLFVRWREERGLPAIRQMTFDGFDK